MSIITVLLFVLCLFNQVGAEIVRLGKSQEKKSTENAPLRSTSKKQISRQVSPENVTFYATLMNAIRI